VRAARHGRPARRRAGHPIRTRFAVARASAQNASESDILHVARFLT
jgi:hypothetical protein